MKRQRSRVAARDVVTEAATALSRRTSRSVLTALGTVVGVGAFVATTGLASTARAQVGESFDALKATEVIVVDTQPGANPFPDDVDARVRQLNGVVDGGVTWSVNIAVRSAPTPALTPADAPVIAASPGALQAAHPTVSEGVLYNDFHNDRAERVVVLGRSAATQLGINRVEHQPAVFVGTTAYTVVGILDDVDRMPELLQAVIIPAATAANDLPANAAGHSVLIDVNPGAAEVVGSQVATALRPNDPNRLQALVPPDPRTLRQQIETDVTSLLYGLAGLALLVGMIGIANTSLVAVLERRAEIGVRRALGARRRHIAAQFLTESAMLGALGGIVGTSLGMIAVVAVALTRDWATTLSPLLTIAAPGVGVAVGLLAGLQPAWRASRITPATALRSQ